jgi:hypothetical protein
VRSPSYLSHVLGRGILTPESMEQTLGRFQERLQAMERECQLFRTFEGWKDESHRARARELLRELSLLERGLNADRPSRLQLAFQQRTLLLRYQTFKRTYRQFWESLTG